MFDKELEWKLIFGVSIWLIWQMKNKFIFENQCLPLEETISQIKSRMDIIKSANSCSALVSSTIFNNQDTRWNPLD